MPGIQIRLMRESDCADVSALQCDSFRWGAVRELFTEQQIDEYCEKRASVEVIREQLQHTICYVALNDNKLVGIIGIEKNLISKLYVHPDCINEGIGRQLFKLAKDKISQGGYTTLEVVTIFPRTILFYQGLGLKIVEQTKVEHGFMTGAVRLKLAMDLSL